MGTKGLLALPPRYGDPFIEEEAEEEVEEEGNGCMKDHLREKETEGLEEVFPMETEEEMEEDFILKYLLKGIRETDRRKNGQYL